MLFSNDQVALLAAALGGQDKGTSTITHRADEFLKWLNAKFDSEHAPIRTDMLRDAAYQIHLRDALVALGVTDQKQKDSND